MASFRLNAEGHESTESSVSVATIDLPLLIPKCAMDPSRLTEVQDRIRAIESQLEVTLGHLKALEFGLRLAIATHKDPNSLMAALDVFEEQVDDRGPLAGPGLSPGYKAAFSEGIAALKQEILSFQRHGPN